MKFTYELAHELFRGYYIERWNDTLRPMSFYEIDKHGHKLIIAYCIAKYEENKGNKIEWETIIKDSVFELLRRIVISDIKSPIFQKIRSEKQIFSELNNYIFKKLEHKFGDSELREEYYNFLFNQEGRDNLTYNVIDAAHSYSSYWEFQIVEKVNPFSYQNDKTKKELTTKLEKYSHLEGIQKLNRNENIKNFIDICGQLRFQHRWSQTPRVPQTSVLGHVTFVAVVTYLLCLELECCKKRLYNNFFGSIFHDLPETVTRDIISPVKKSSPELDNLISKIERELAEKEIFPYLEENWIDEIKYFTQNEFNNKIIKNDKVEFVSIDDINKFYNSDEYFPYDGELIKFADHYSAYLEAKNSIDAGISSVDLLSAARDIKEKYSSKKIADLNIYELF